VHRAVKTGFRHKKSNKSPKHTITVFNAYRVCKICMTLFGANIDDLGLP